MSYSILVVDDNTSNAKLAQKILTGSGYEVKVATCGLAAIEMASAQRPDLVLLDIRLPDIDGLEVLRRLRSIPDMTDVLIIAMTAQAMPEEVASFVAAGCDGYIQKPISVEAFRTEVQRHLGAVAGKPRLP
jgi:two-component system, cell cycle response regulator DivK